MKFVTPSLAVCHWSDGAVVVIIKLMDVPEKQPAPASTNLDAPEAMQPALLPGKLYRPTPPDRLVARPRLLRALEEGRLRGRPLTLIVAPAGYGKSTLAAVWTHHAQQNSNVQVAWLTLDPDDNDPARFYTYLAAALAPTIPGAESTLRRLLGAMPQPTPKVLITALLMELAEASRTPHLLVLDDVQYLRSPALHEDLAFLIANRPSNLHLALVTRQDPPVPLARWRVRDQITEIRASHLRFTTDETDEFLQLRGGQQLTQAAVAALAQRTEGWAAGLQLVSLAIQNMVGETRQGHVDAFVQAFSGSHHYVIDYLVEEVLSQLPNDVRHFLRQTAVLDRFCAPLCAAVLQVHETDAQAMLATLAEANLFLLPLDDERRWYRYHPLFADCLRVDLEPQTCAVAHKRAASWFGAEGHFGQAVDHAVAAGDTDLLAYLLGRAAGPVLQQGQITRLTKWLVHLPREQLLNDPVLAVYYLLCLILSGRSHEAPPLLPPLVARSATWHDPRQRARLLAIRAWLADITDSEDRITLAHEAAAARQTDDVFFNAFVAVPLGHAHIFEDKLPLAVACFREGLTRIRDQESSFARISLLGNLAHALNLQGHRHQALATCQESIDIFSDRRGNPLPPAGLSLLLRGWFHYQANDLQQAQDDAREALRLLPEAFQDTMLTSLEAELPALLAAAAGDGEQALALVRQGQARATRQQYRQAMRALALLEADLHLREGNLGPVRRWAAELHYGSNLLHDQTHVTGVRLLFADGERQEACNRLSPLIASARDGERGYGLITLLLLQSICDANPIPAITEAVERASCEGYVRLLIDECAFPAHGPQLVALLRRSDVRQVASSFMREVLAALDKQGGADSLPSVETINETILDEPLTDQELNVLRLLVAGHSNREIAAELVVTVGTAKWHVHNVYGKLGVNNRLDAVLRAQALGLA